MAQHQADRPEAGRLPLAASAGAVGTLGPFDDEEPEGDDGGDDGDGEAEPIRYVPGETPDFTPIRHIPGRVDPLPFE